MRFVTMETTKLYATDIDTLVCGVHLNSRTTLRWIGRRFLRGNILVYMKPMKRSNKRYGTKLRSKEGEITDMRTYS